MKEIKKKKKKQVPGWNIWGTENDGVSWRRGGEDKKVYVPDNKKDTVICYV